MSELEPLNQAPAPALEKPGTLDLIVLTTAMGMMFALGEGLPELANRPMVDSQLMELINKFFSAIYLGVPLAGLFFISRRLWQRKRLTQAGHWMLFFSAIQSMLQVALLIFVALAIDRSDPSVVFLKLLLMGMAVSYLAGFTLLIVGCFNITGTWRLLLWLVAITAGLMAVDTLATYKVVVAMMENSNGISNFSSVLTQRARLLSQLVVGSLLVLATIISLVRRKTRHDWVHWLGVFTIVFSFLATPLYQYIQSWLIFRQMNGQ